MVTLMKSQAHLDDDGLTASLTAGRGVLRRSKKQTSGGLEQGMRKEGDIIASAILGLGQGHDGVGEPVLLVWEGEGGGSFLLQVQSIIGVFNPCSGSLCIGPGLSAHCICFDYVL